MEHGTPLTTPLSHALVAFTIEFDNEFERRFSEAGGGARVASLVMWSNFMRFVGEGITVGELPGAAGLHKALTRSTARRHGALAVRGRRAGRRAGDRQSARATEAAADSAASGSSA